MTSPWRVRAARAVYEGLLRLAPRPIRHQYGMQMRATFAALLDHAVTRGLPAVMRLLLNEATDILRARRPSRFTTIQPEREVLLHLPQPLHLLRAVTRRPLFALAITGTLAFGTGVTTTVFSVVDAVLLRPLPFPDGDRLVTVFESSPTAPGRPALAAPARIADWNRESRSFVALSGSYGESVTDTSTTDPDRLEGRRVLPGYFTVFGAVPALGRTFSEGEQGAGGPAAAVISEALWSRRFGRDPGVIHRALTIGGTNYSVVGVMARSFGSAVDVWLPAQIGPQLMGIRDARFVSGIGRMKAGVSIDEATADIARIQQGLGESFPKTDLGWSAVLTDLKESQVGSRRGALWLGFGLAGFVWLIGVANVAGLVLVDARRRSQELAIRAALGASRARVISHVTQEVLVLAIIGGAGGLAAAAGLLRLVPRVFEALPRLNGLALDWQVTAFALGTSLVAALLCGVIPALHATRQGVTLVAGGRRGTTTAQSLAQRWLVGVQVALAVVLCASAAVLASSYYELTRVDRGFSADGVVTFHVAARWDENRARVGQMQVELLSSLEHFPGVTYVGLANFLPAPGGSLRYQVSVDGLAGDDGKALFSAGTRMISAGYLPALQAALVAGTWCPAFRHDFNAPTAALINRKFVERYASGQNLIGRTLRMAEVAGASATIVGVVGDLAEDGPQVERFPFVYTCDSAGSWPDPHYVVRTANPAALLAGLRGVVRRIDPTRAVFGVRDLHDVVDASVAEPRRNAAIIGLVAAAALMMGACGLYALFMRLVAESRREIGVRLALGARPGQIVRGIVADASRLLAAGVLAGGIVAGGAYVFLRSVLFGLGPFDLAAVMLATVVLAGVSLVAILVPAVRASRVMPTEALRAE